MSSGMANIQYFSTDFYAGWHAMQMGLMLKIYTKNEPQEFVNQYLSSLRPEIAQALVKDADDLCSPQVASMIKQYKEEWDGSQ